MAVPGSGRRLSKDPQLSRGISELRSGGMGPRDTAEARLLMGSDRKEGAEILGHVNVGSVKTL